MAEYGIKVSKPGVDVKTASEEDLVINSLYYSLKEGLFADLSTELTNGLLEYNHNLGYPPAYLVFIELPTVGGFMKLPGRYDIGGGTMFTGIVFVDSEKITIRAGYQYDGSANPTDSVRIILFEDEGL